MNRRDFIKQSLIAGTAIAATTGGIFILGSRNGSNISADMPGSMPKDFRVPDNGKFPTVAVVKSDDTRLATAEAIALLGGIERFIGKGDKVFVKPNIAWDRLPEQGANTHPDIVAEICRLCFKAGASKVFVGDVTCNDPERTYNRSGIKAAAAAQGAEVIMISGGELVDMNFGFASIGKWPVIKKILEADKVINLPVIKHHSLSGMTAGMKNWFGALSGSRNRLHQEIDFSIAELARLFRPTLTLLDATRVMQKGGPTGGRPDDLVSFQTIVAATDPVAAESYACRFLDKKPDDFPYIKMAADTGLGEIHLPTTKMAFKEI